MSLLLEQWAVPAQWLRQNDTVPCLWCWATGLRTVHCGRESMGRFWFERQVICRRCGGLGRISATEALWWWLLPALATRGAAPWILESKELKQ